MIILNSGSELYTLTYALKEFDKSSNEFNEISIFKSEIMINIHIPFSDHNILIISVWRVT